MRKRLMVKTQFSNIVLVKNGRGSIKVYPQTGQVGPATFHTYRYSDQAMPSQGDHWEFGQDIVSGFPAYQLLERSFVLHRVEEAH